MNVSKSCRFNGSTFRGSASVFMALIKESDSFRLLVLTAYNEFGSFSLFKGTSGTDSTSVFGPVDCM